MKAILLLSVALFWQVIANGQDLPNPSPNLQTLPQDSYIIAMDNTWQATTGTNPAYHYFNLKAYGLIVYLLNNNVKVKRVIRAGKVKDDVDFSVSCRQVKPTLDPAALYRSFRAGPFVIMGPDLLRVNIDALIDTYNNNYGGISGIGSDTAKVRVYKTTADATVDVRHDLTGFKPKATILTDGSTASGINYTQVHLTYFSLAGVPASNYTSGANSDLAVNCFTFASEPHNDFQNQTVVDNIRSFVLDGGNFLAQCAAITTYESLGKFQSGSGLTLANTTPASVYYPNADLGMAQFEGGFSIRQGGSYQNWKYNTSAFANSAHAFATNTNGVVNGTSLIGASASKLTGSSSTGGLTFYLGNHSYTKTDDYNHINGIRMYLNALLTPPNTKNILRYAYTADCNVGAMKVASFNGPPLAYPVDFYLYQDNGAVPGSVDAADAFVGATSVPSAGVQKLIPLNGADPNSEFVMRVVPSASCYKAEQVSPAPCKLATLSASLRNFSATRSGGEVLLRWQTLAEQGNDGFYVQRLAGSDWRDIGFVPSSAAGGNSNTRLQYQYITEAVNRTTQYRVKMQGVDKSIHYSDVRLVQAEASTSLFTLSPNPSTTGNCSVVFSGKGTYSVVLCDVAGRVVRAEANITNTVYELVKLPRGVYLLKVSDAAGKTDVQKLIVN